MTTEVPPDDEPPTADLDVPQPAVEPARVSRPRPVRAAATGSAAAGERTSSGELPVSVTPPAWDERPAADRRPRPAARRAAALLAAARHHHDGRRRRLRDRSPGAGRSRSRSRSWPGSSTPSTGRGTPRTIANGGSQAGAQQRTRGSWPGCGARGTSRSTRGPSRTAGSSSTTWWSARPASTRSTRRSGTRRLPIRTLQRQAALPRPGIAEGAARARRLGGRAGQRDPVRGARLSTSRSGRAGHLRAEDPLGHRHDQGRRRVHRDGAAQVPQAARPDERDGVPRLTREQVRTSTTRRRRMLPTSAPARTFTPVG